MDKTKDTAARGGGAARHSGEESREPSTPSNKRARQVVAPEAPVKKRAVQRERAPLEFNNAAVTATAAAVTAETSNEAATSGATNASAADESAAAAAAATTRSQTGEAVGEQQSQGAPAHTTGPSAESGYCMLCVCHDVAEINYKVRRTTRLGKMMQRFCGDHELDQTVLRFIVNGERIKADDTANSLVLEDGDIVTALAYQTGGGGARLHTHRS